MTSLNVHESFSHKNPKQHTEIIHYNQNKEREGEYVSYYDNGNIREKSHYINGELDGIQLLFNENGELEETISYKKGLKHGDHFIYKNTKIITKNRYDNGHLIKECNLL